MPNRNRDAGNEFERKIVNLLRPLFPKAITSRFGSRELDAAKVDIMHTDPFNFQCKLTKMTPIRVLEQMPDDKNINVIVWGKTEKVHKYIVNKGTYAILKLDDLIDIIETGMIQNQSKDEV